MDFNVLVQYAVNFAVVGLFGAVIANRVTIAVLRVKVENIENGQISTEAMRGIMKDENAALFTELHHLREELEQMRSQLAGRRNTD